MHQLDRGKILTKHDQKFFFRSRDSMSWREDDLEKVNLDWEDISTIMRSRVRKRRCSIYRFGEKNVLSDLGLVVFRLNLFWLRYDRMEVVDSRKLPKISKVPSLYGGEESNQNKTKHDSLTAGPVFLHQMFNMSPNNQL